MAILQIIIILIVPLLLIKFRNWKGIKFIGAIGASYLIGIIIALTVYFIRKSGANIAINTDICEIGSYLAISIAIPLLLFNTDFKALKSLSKKTLTSFGILIVSVVIVSLISFFTFRNAIANNGKLAGMAIGLYTGGTPNLNAIGSILGVQSSIIALANISDMVIGAIFYLFLLTICKPILKKFLKSPSLDKYYQGSENVKNVDMLESKGIKKLPLIRNLLIALVIAIIGAGIGYLIWFLRGAEDGKMLDNIVPSIMITSTILGLVGSFNKKIREVKGNNLLGHYLIIVFSIAIAMSINIGSLSTASLYIFLEFTFITIVAFFLHIILSKIFKIDVDCAMVTLTAGLYGPAFIPAITTQLKNDNLTSVGLICGSLGYAIGTFLGSGIGFLLMLI
ncbi:MAG: DUF819 family protein [Clostridia bacterium]